MKKTNYNLHTSPLSSAVSSAMSEMASSLVDGLPHSLYDKMEKRGSLNFDALLPVPTMEHSIFEEIRNIKNVLSEIKLQLSEFSIAIKHISISDNGEERQNMSETIETLNVKITRSEGKIDILGTKLDSIDKTLENINKKLDEKPSKEAAENMILKYGKTVDDSFANIKTDIQVIHTRVNDSITNKKWMTTTAIATIGAAAAIIKLFL